jgi:hypothetical protein
MSRILGMLAIAVMLVSGCDSVENPFESDDKVKVSDPDAAGNLIVRNMTGERIVLFRGEERLKVIPDDQSDYLISVPNPNAERVDLRVYRLVDIESNINSPSVSAFKRWIVPLAPDNDAEHRSTWAVLADDRELESGTLTFSYIGGTENFVDVFLNSKTGAKIASLRPGAERSQVGVDYGTYTVFYNYWFSDQNDQNPAGFEDRGWTETEVVNGDDVDIYAVLNENRQRQHLQVPHLGAELKPWGNLQVQNKTSTPVLLWIGSTLIEEVVYTDGSRKNISTVAANENVDFVLPTGEHIVIAKGPTSNAEIGRANIALGEGESYTWDIQSGTVTGSIEVSGEIPD